MKLLKDTDHTSLSLSPAVLAWASPSLYENWSTTYYTGLQKTSVYLHWRRTLRGQLWESCRWQQIDHCTWKKKHLLMSLDLIGRTLWEQEDTTYSITGGQRQPITFSHESGTWQRLSTVGTSSSTTSQSWFLLRKTETKEKL